MIIRNDYLDKIRGFYDSDLVKVITGVRRCGKSVILETIMTEISKKTTNILYLNFERNSDYVRAGDVESLIKYVHDNKKEGKCYCFFDEIQEVSNWQKAVKDLRLENCSIFITGSNSKLLSSEFLTLLSGRFVSFRIRPFVYKEIAEYSKELQIEVTPTDYLIWGGFPGRFQNTSLEGTKAYLHDLENTIVVNDLIKRYKIKKEAVFRKIVSYILVNNARILSARSIYKYMKNEVEKISLATVLKYISCLKEGYIIDEINQYSTKAKKELSFYQKTYNSDVCFNSLKAQNNRFDLDHNLENAVYNELLFRGYDLKVFDNNGKEIDFMATKDNKKYFVQVAYSVVEQKTYNSELGAFASLDNLNQKILITCDDVDFSTSTVKHIKFKDFIMSADL